MHFQWRGTLRRAGGSGSSFNSGTLTNSPNVTATPVQSHYLMCSMRDFGHTAGGDEAELLLWLHDARRAQPLSERFRVRIARDGFSNYVDRLHANSTLFADLSSTDLSRELWLVAWVIRVGRWSGAGGSGTGERRGPVARRPLGAGVLPLSEFLRQPEPQTIEKEYTFKVYQCEEKDFHQLHDMLIRKQTNKCNILPGQPNYGIVVALRLITNTGSISEAVASGATVTAKRGFPDVIMPGDVRNDLYLTLERAEFERGGKSTAKNVLATVSVHDITGQVINRKLDDSRDGRQECVWGASGAGATAYESLVLYHNNAPAWGEQLRLTVPLDTFTHAHVRLEYRHCSTRDKNERKLFGFSFARLMEASGATLRDGAHDLYVYKCDDPSKLLSASYLSLPSCANDTARTPATNGVLATFQRSTKENCIISTLLCSTKLTQNEDLLALLQWRARPEKVQETLLRVLRLGDGLSCEELIKFLRDVLDALFALFSTEDGNSTPHSGTVFLVLVSICSLLDEPRFQHFRPVLDVYIEEHFSAALVYKGLLSSVQHCAEWAAGAEGQEPIRKCLRSLGAVFRLAVRSRRLFASATGGQYEDSFRRDVRAALHALKALAQHPHRDHLAPAQYEDSFRRDVRAALHALKALAQHPHRDHLAPAQIALMTSWASVAKEVASALGPVEAGRITAAMLDAPAANAPPALARARLAAAQDILKGPLGQDPEARNIVLTTACHHLRVHLARRDELSQCAEMLGELVTLLWKKEDPDQPVDEDELDPDVDVLCLNTLDVLVETVLHLIGGNTPVLCPMVAGLLGVMELLKPAHYQRLWSHLAPHPHDRKPLKDFLMRAFLVFRHLIEHDVFPPDWMVLRVQSCKVLLSALQDLAKPLLERFLGDEPPQFDSQLWSGYLELCVSLVTASALQAEQWARGPQRAAMRSAAALHLLAVWTRLGPAQLQLIGPAVSALLEVTLVGSLRRAALGALVALMAAERAATGSARRTEAALVDKLDSLVADNKADDQYRRLFDTVEHLSSVLMERVSTEGWREAGAAFVGCVTRLLERLLDYRAVMQGAEHRDKRMAATVNLLVSAQCTVPHLLCVDVCVTRLLERLLDYRAVMQGAEHRDKRMAATVNLLVSAQCTVPHLLCVDVCVTRLLERLLDYRAVMQGAEHRDKRMAATVNLLVSAQCTVPHLLCVDVCVTRLLERLLDYRAVMQGAEHRDKRMAATVNLLGAEHRDRRMAATVNLLNFYKNEIDRKEMYLRYVYKLHDLHIASDNWVEAGCTLLLYAETLNWDSDQIGVDPEHPETPEWKRKEALYNQVLQYFDRGKCWEKGLPLLRELATLYETRLCDYARLAHCLRTHATFLDCILEQLRPEPEYFRVGFYGKGCPLFVRNKQFVYRGLDYERIGAFTQRLQAEYVSAHILMRNTPPDDSVIASDGQYIQICNVKPVGARRAWPGGAPEPAKRFYACNDVDTFLCDRPLHKPPIDKDNEFKSLWIERTTLVTENTLPGILRWSEVISRSVEEIPPVEFACETMEATERELRSLISQYTADPTQNINPFSMRLQGTIDANVQGGITKYEQAFLGAEFARSATPREAAAAARLRRLVASQLAVVDAGLALHGRLAPDEVKPLHRRLVERFTQLRQNLGPGLARARRQLSESIVNTPLPPVPALDKRSHSIQQNDNYYEDGHLYNKPIYSLEDSMDQQSGIMSNSVPLDNRDNRDNRDVTDDSMIKSAPPLPSRPKSGDPRSPTRPCLDKYREAADDEVETRRHSRASWSEPGDAPPLPPRVSGDKRAWGEAPAVPRRARGAEERDSGVSVDHLYTNAPERDRDPALDKRAGTGLYSIELDCKSHSAGQEDMDIVESLRYEEIISMMSEPLHVDEGETPPPIPPKGLGHISSFDSGHHENGESHC
ncbi:unnamed protein product [Euphydryas editha]|uniref:Dedicator of cytokinesis protein 3 n=1 Tax=Euphydryas editha TaxID=104508 RepID=A0AAU9VAF7_EUPED|nr:unnamed protein product [Euphydryas editha]